MEDDTINQLKTSIQVIRDNRAEEKATHLSECKAASDAIARMERGIQALLNSKAGLSQRECKKIMEDVYGGLSNAPPRYVLEQQAMLLHVSHRIGILQNELERRNAYKIRMEQYMSCEKSVLRSESDEVLAELQEIASVSQEGDVARGMPERNENMLKDESNAQSRPGFLRNLSPSSIFKGSFNKAKKLPPQLLQDAAAPSAPPLYSPAESATE